MDEKNLVRLMNAATPQQWAAGTQWYLEAHDACVAMAEELQLPLQAVVGVVAAISPGLRWDFNLSHAHRLLRAWVDGVERDSMPIVGVYGRRNVDKALRCIRGVDPLTLFSAKTSPKVRAFYATILDPTNNHDVVIDRHAVAAVENTTSPKGGSGEPAKQLTPTRYEAYADLYRTVAKSYNLLPHQVQAIVWTVWRDALPVNLSVA